jgi:hypothetical protein
MSGTGVDLDDLISKSKSVKKTVVMSKAGVVNSWIIVNVHVAAPETTDKMSGQAGALRD